MTTFMLPDLGEGLQEAEIVSWHVAAGDHVVVNQPLLSVETDKAVVEIPSPVTGRVGELFAKAGDRVQVGAPLLEFQTAAHTETGTVVGQLPQPAPGPAHAPPPESAGPAHIKAMPAVRARARQLGLELASIQPSGVDGSVTMSDLEAAIREGAAGGETVALRGARRAMATNMAKAWREVVHATIQDEADVDAWAKTEDTTWRLVRAIVAACKAEPQMNAVFDPMAMALKPSEDINLGLAVDSSDGLFAPVLRKAQTLNAAECRASVERLKRGVADRSLPTPDLRGATISLSNFGSIAGRHAALIVVPPQVAIVGAGRIGRQAVLAADGTLAMRRMLPLSISFDHRAITGGTAARFLRTLMDDLQSTKNEGQ